MTKQLWTPEEVLARIRSLNEAGHDLAFGNASALAPKLVSAAARYFGSWARAVEETGVDYSSLIESSRQRALEKRSKWSKELIVERIRELAGKKESLEVAVIARKYRSLYSAACSPRYFSGWAQALEAAGIQVEPRARGGRTQLHDSLKDWRKGLLLERITQIAGSDSNIDEHTIRTLAPTLHQAAVKSFGSWAKTVRAIQVAGEAPDMTG